MEERDYTSGEWCSYTWGMWEEGRWTSKLKTAKIKLFIKYFHVFKEQRFLPNITKCINCGHLKKKNINKNQAFSSGSLCLNLSSIYHVEVSVLVSDEEQQIDLGLENQFLEKSDQPLKLMPSDLNLF